MKPAADPQLGRQISFTVPGVPAPQGSKRAFVLKGTRRAVVVESSAKVKPWRSAVVVACQEAQGCELPFDGPIYLEVDFFLPRPQGLKKSVYYPARRPDLDKLLRSTLDGITDSGAIGDDSQIVRIEARKHFAGGPFDNAGPQGYPRAEIVLTRV